MVPGRRHCSRSGTRHVWLSSALLVRQWIHVHVSPCSDLLKFHRCSSWTWLSCPFVQRHGSDSAKTVRGAADAVLPTGAVLGRSCRARLVQRHGSDSANLSGGEVISIFS